MVTFDDSDESELRGPHALYSLRRSLERAHACEGIAVRAVEERAAGLLSARFDAQWREYHYHILATGDTPPLFMRDRTAWYRACRTWTSPPMQRGSDATSIGEHDFKSFCMAASGRRQAHLPQRARDLAFAAEDHSWASRTR